ncbi:MAG: maltose alpha-D-glucosyltransferase, partial [bacterium]|nr:maltose alpha-D-glucosyltransferase [bacterium]
HRRGFRVITELVLNHTSDQHPWFQRARLAPPGSPERDFYVWTQDPSKYKEVRIIFPDFESSNWSWDPQAQSYYWHRFFSHQPDLNYDNPQVQKTMLEVVDFWFKEGVDGLRLDAIPYLFEREGTDCVGLPETHAYLRKLRHHVDSKFKEKMFLAEANMWPEDAISFFGNGDECHMSFHFPLMPRLFMAVKMENRYPIEEILEQTPPIPETCQWANFLRNHDELTLEMVTDEERDYMYRAFVHDPQAKINAGIRRRLSPLLRNNRKQIELLNGLLFSLPGTPVVYYGDEIGMGDNIYLGDRNGVRTPMQWSSDRNAGFSRSNPQKLISPVVIDPEYHFEAVNVEAQQNNPHSLLWWMRRVINLRKRNYAFSRGSLEILHPDNHKILAFVRKWENQEILVVANLSRFSQGTYLDLSPFAGKAPIELFGKTSFPNISKEPYFFTLAPHSFYWFSLEVPKEERALKVAGVKKRTIPSIKLAGKWDDILNPRNKDKLVDLLPDYLTEQHWFAGRAYKIRNVKILGEISLFPRGFPGFLLLLQSNFVDHEFQAYLVGLIFGSGKKFQNVRRRFPQHILAEVEVPEEKFKGGLYNAVSEPAFCKVLLDYIAHRRGLKSTAGEIQAIPTPEFKKIKKEQKGSLTPKVLEGEQANTLIIFGKTFVLKIFRQLEWGTNPEIEMYKFLNSHKFKQIPQLAGTIDFRQGKQKPVTLCLLLGYVDHQSSAWDYTLDSLGQFFDSALATEMKAGQVPVPKGSLFKISQGEPTDLARDLLGGYLPSVNRLGEVTVQLHRTLAGDPQDELFAPEPFDPHYQRSLYQSIRGLCNRTLKTLRKELNLVPKETRPLVEKVLKNENKIMKNLDRLLEDTIEAVRIRCHGDFHLGQVLYTGKDFVIFDFEGEPTRHWSARKLKRSPLKDVAGMLRSFHYALHAALQSDRFREIQKPEQRTLLEAWGRYWYAWVGASYLRAYLQGDPHGDLFPKVPQQQQTLLRAGMIEKCLYEIAYELEHRPHWLQIPLQGMAQLLEN